MTLWKLLNSFTGSPVLKSIFSRFENKQAPLNAKAKAAKAKAAKAKAAKAAKATAAKAKAAKAKSFLMRYITYKSHDYDLLHGPFLVDVFLPT